MRSKYESFVAYERIMNNIHSLSGIASKRNSLNGWFDRARQMHEAIEKVNQDFDRDVAAINEVYRDAAARETIKPLEDHKNALVKAAVKEVSEDLTKVMAAKRKRLDDVQNAPTAEQAALLQVLNLRTSLTDAEVATAALKLKGSLVCLAALGDIARKCGVQYPTISAEEIESSLDTGEKAAFELLRSIEMRDADMGYMERLSWVKTSKGEYAKCPAQSLFDALDTDDFTAALKSKTQTEEESQTGTPATPKKQRIKNYLPDHNATRVYMRGGERATTVCMQFGCTLRDLNACNPGVDLNKPFNQGDLLIVPRIEFTHLGEPGSIDIEQCLSIKHNPEEHKTYSPGQRVNVVEEG